LTGAPQRQRWWGPADPADPQRDRHAVHRTEPPAARTPAAAALIPMATPPPVHRLRPATTSSEPARPLT